MPLHFIDPAIARVGGFRLTGYAKRIERGVVTAEEILFDVLVPAASEPCVRHLVCERLAWGSALITELKLAHPDF